MTRIAFTVLAFLVFVSRAWAFEVTAFTTPKGIEVWHVEERSVPLISMDFAFDTGTLTDPEGKEGTAYLLSSLLDEGAGKLSGEEFRLQRDDNALRFSFRASADWFYGSLQTPAANSAIALDLMRLALNDPHIPADALERVRQQALVSAQSRTNSPTDIAFFAAGSLAMPGHPYMRYSQGTEKSLPSITRDDVVASRQRIFTRRNLKVAVVGAISRAEVAAAVDKLFGDLPEFGQAVDIKEAAPISSSATKVLEWDMPQTFILFGGNGVPDSSPDYRAAQLLFQIVGGDGSRLHEELREKRGLTYSVGFGPFAYRNAAFSLGYMQVENARAGEALSVTRDVLREVAKNGVTIAELEAAKQFLAGSFAFYFESSGATSSSLLNFMTLGLSPDYHKTRNADVGATKLEDVNAIARKLLDVEKLIVVAIGRPVGIEAK
jgi:zinc protease